MRVFQYLLFLISVSTLYYGCSKEPEVSDEEKFAQLTEEEQRLPQNALLGLEAPDDLEVTMFASEPMLINPTNMDIDARGRVWVCEGYNYRPTLNPNNPTEPEGDRIVILEDTDGDGKADDTKVFYQGNDINAALGIAVFGKNVFVSVSPNVFVFTDEDEDGKADDKKVLFTGLGGEQHDHAVHAFVFGPDGKVYFNYGNAGEHLRDAEGNVIVDKAGNEVLANGTPYRQGMVFRCNPDGSEFEVLGHNFRNNYEVAVDSYGTLWQSDNDDDGNRGVRINYVMEYGNYGYTDEMTGAGWRARRTNMNSEIPLRHWHLNDPGVVPNLLQTGAGSPTGILLYEGDLLPERFHNQIIHSDAGPNVVRAYPVENDGAGYKATIENIVQGRDQWFRPSDVCVAPDGSLFIADWYDPGVGGHQMRDQEEGRVFRVAPADTPYTVPEYDYSTAEGAAKALQSPNMAVRYLAWNALHEMGDQAKPALEAMYSSENSRMKARAFWLLADLDQKYIQQALQDENPDIRITAIRAARLHKLDLVATLTPLLEDPSAQVRREIAIAIRHLKAPEQPQMWAKLADQYDGKDRWYLEALGIASDLNADADFAAWIEGKDEPVKDKAARDIIWRVRSKAALPYMKEAILAASPETDSTEILRFFRAFDFHKEAEKQAVLSSLLKTEHPEQTKIMVLALKHSDPDQVRKNSALRSYIDKALTSVEGTQDYLDLIETYQLNNQNDKLIVMAENNLESNLGAEALGLALRMGGEKKVKTKIQQSDEAQSIAWTEALGRVNSEESRNLLKPLIADASEKMEVRKAAVNAIGNGGWGGENQLLDMVKNGEIPAELKETVALRLSQAHRESIRKEAALYLDIPEQATNKALPPVSELVAKEGDATHGKEMFASKGCKACHQINGEGIDFGPNLSEIGNKLSKGALFVSIMYPDEGLNFGYEGWVIKMKNGQEEVGYIASETEDEIQLKKMGGITTPIAKSDIASREELEGSLMTNLSGTMTEQELVDLVEYLSSLKKAAVSAL